MVAGWHTMLATAFLLLGECVYDWRVLGLLGRNVWFY